jgi:hypothetical protein
MNTEVVEFMNAAVEGRDVSFEISQPSTPIGRRGTLVARTEIARYSSTADWQ